MLTCNLCRQPAERFVDSHVYPRALHRQMHDGESQAFAINSNPDHPKQSVQRDPSGRHGYYVCRTCEDQRFNLGDDEVCRLFHALRRHPPGELLTLKQGIVRVTGDPVRLHRFALQTIWRWSTLDESRMKPRVGPLVERIQEWLMADKETIDSGREVAVVYHQHDMDMIVLEPSRFGRVGKEMIVFTVPTMTFIVPMRTRWLPGRLREGALRREGLVRMLVTKEAPGFVLRPLEHMLAEGRMAMAEEYVAGLEARSAIKDV